MQKLILPMLFVIATTTQAEAQQRLFDQPVQLKTCNISIEANSFIANTTIEMEFYNPKDQEVEARQEFRLNRGQVITDFQLELNGKYREGSIEERGKARAAYSSVVGKRIDPALLQMNWQDNYSLNIYPVPAKSSRKVKFTITQMMKAENSKLMYDLPLNFTGSTALFNLEIKVTKPVSIPYANAGFLENHFFDMGNGSASFLLQQKNITVNKPVSFSINQFGGEPQICLSKQNGKSEFLMRLFPQVPSFYKDRTKKINVYWDVSLSGNERNLTKELDYLEKYITENEIDKTTIILFNQQVQGTVIFTRENDNFNAIRNYLISYKYAGATELGNLNFSNVLADRVLLFSDFINSVGKSQPKPGAVQVNCILSTTGFNYDYVKGIIGNTGGSVINLYNTEVKDAVKKTDSAEVFLYKYNTSQLSLNEIFPVKLSKNILLSGTIKQSDNLELVYGNNTNMIKSENYFLSTGNICDAETYHKMQMLKTYDSMMYANGQYYYYGWQDMIVFGLTEKVVTMQTSYLVLERIEDYIKYKIAPPAELVEACAERNYVYKQEYKLRELKTFTEQDALEGVVKQYNQRIAWWGGNADLIDLNKPEILVSNAVAAANGTLDKGPAANGYSAPLEAYKATSSDLKEVVVTSAFGTKRAARSVSSNVQNISAEQLNVIRQSNINNALAGKVSGLQVRSQAFGKLGAESVIRLRGENNFGVSGGPLFVVDGTVIPSSNDINPDDIEDITVLQGPSASALFGPDGSNGAIVINYKKGRRNNYYTNYWSSYKLNSTEDEDYIVEMRKAESYEYWEVLAALEKRYQGNVGFYFEMADFLFETGRTDKAQELMYNAIELCQGSVYGLKLAAYQYEKWKYFEKAIGIYKGILSANENNMLARRDLALAYFQNKEYPQAVKTYYALVTAAVDNSSNIKEMALAEMNAILAMHKNEFDISYINHNLVKALPADLRITVESNYDNIRNPQVIEPGDVACNAQQSKTKNGGRVSGDLWNNQSLNEYIIKKAPGGSYKIKLDAYNSSNYRLRVPMYVRVISFKNFQNDNMKMEVRLFNLDNQYGAVELDQINW